MKRKKMMEQLLRDALTQKYGEKKSGDIPVMTEQEFRGKGYTQNLTYRPPRKRRTLKTALLVAVLMALLAGAAVYSDNFLDYFKKVNVGNNDVNVHVGQNNKREEIDEGHIYKLINEKYGLKVKRPAALPGDMALTNEPLFDPNRPTTLEYAGEENKVFDLTIARPDNYQERGYVFDSEDGESEEINIKGTRILILKSVQEIAEKTKWYSAEWETGMNQLRIDTNLPYDTLLEIIKEFN